jgi:hypothetical protein
MTGNSGKFLTTNGTIMSWVNITGTDVTGAALTEVDDTNVTMTLGGSPSTALLRSVSMTLGWAGQLAVSRGGTGASTLTGVLVGNGTSAFTAVVGTAGQFLRRNTANTAYEFRTLQGSDIAGSELTFSNDTNVQMTLGGTPASALLQPVSINLGWTGQLAVSRGGTGASTLTGVLIGNGTSAVTAITGTAGQILRRNTGNTAYEFWSANYLVNPMTLEGSIIYATTGGTPAELFANNTSTNKYLRSVNGTAPTWEALPASVGGSGTTNYVSKWTASTTLGNSLIYDNGTNVGIGTPSPAYKFVVSNSSTVGMELDPGTIVSGTNRLLSYNRATSAYVNYEILASNIILTPSSNVGIGNTTPSYKLDVSGTARFTGNVLASNVINLIGAENNSAKIKAGKFLSIADDGFSVGINYTSDSIPLSGFLLNINGNTYNHGNLTLRSTYNLTWGGAYGTDIPTISGTSATSGYLSFYPTGSSSGEKMRLLSTGQLRLNGYTSTSSFSGLTVGLLGFTSTGAITTYSIPGGVSGTQDYLAKFDSTGVAVANSRIVDNGTNFLFNSASAYVTGLNLIGDIGIQSASGQASAILMRSNQTPTSGTSIGIIDSYAITTGSTYTQSAGMDFRASQNWNSTSAGTDIYVQTAPDNTIAPADMFVFLNNGAVRFIGRTSNPIGAAAGTMYYNSSANNMRYYNGTSWITF